MKTKNNEPFLSKFRITQQILLVFLTCTVIPLLILGLWGTQRAKGLLSEQYESLADADSARIKSILFDITTSIYTTSDTVFSGNDCMYLFASKTPENLDGSYERISDAMDAIFQHNAAVSSIHLYTDNPAIPDGTYITSLSDGYEGQDWYTASSGQHWQTWTCLSVSGQNLKDPSQLTLIRRVPVASREYTAWLVIRLDSNYLKNRINNTSRTVLIAFEDAPVFYSTDSRWLQKKPPLPPGREQNASACHGFTDIDGVPALVSLCTLTAYQTDSLFYIETVDFTAYQSIHDTVLIYLLILAIAVAAPTAIILIFSFRLGSRIRTLRAAMHQARMGDYNIIESFQGNDELKDTFQDLKATVEIIHEKDARYYEAQITRQKLINQQQQMEFKMLASQINPHFLYNTLETIRMLSLTGKNKETATAIKMLGKSMHYVLETTTTEFTTLEKELDYVRTYLSIQQIRFGERVRFSIETAPGLMPKRYPILPLLLQPVVENAFIHGLRDTDRDGCIEIYASIQDQMLFLTVRDNGAGMEREELDALNQKIQLADVSSSESIGLHNICQRIRLCYKEKAQILIESTPGRGTLVTLILPDMAEQEGGLE